MDEWPYHLELDPVRFHPGWLLRWQYDEDGETVMYQYGPLPSTRLVCPYASAAEIVALVRQEENSLVAWLQGVARSAPDEGP